MAALCRALGFGGADPPAKALGAVEATVEEEEGKSSAGVGRPRIHP